MAVFNLCGDNVINCLLFHLELVGNTDEPITTASEWTRQCCFYSETMASGNVRNMVLGCVLQDKVVHNKDLFTAANGTTETERI